MSAETRRLPLFPLNVVLFPEASIPLQIFEERYKTMLQDCLDADSLFGVVLIKSGNEVGEPAEPYRVGTVAKIVQVTDAGQGRLFVSATGGRRFRILEIVQKQPYIAAEVDLLSEEADSDIPLPDLAVLRATTVRYTRTVVGLGGGWLTRLPMPSEPTRLSYFIPKLLQVELPHKQALLEMPGAAMRLRAEQSILETQYKELKQRLTRELLGKYSRS